jgi:hypothetical protein
MCKAIVKSCNKYGISNSLDASKDEILLGGRKVQKTKIRMCSIAVMRILRDSMTSTNFVLYCHTVGYIFPNLSFKRKENGRSGKGNAIPVQAWKGPEGSRRYKLLDFETIGKSGW